MRKQTKSFFFKIHLVLEHVWSLCPNLGVITLDVILKIVQGASTRTCQMKRRRPEKMQQ